MIHLVHPLGNAFVREALKALVEVGWLEAFWTGLAFRPGSAWGRLLPPGWRSELERRAFGEVPPGRLRARPWLEAARLLAARAGWSGPIRHETGRWSVDAVFRDLDRAAARAVAAGAPGAAVYAYEDGAAEVLAAAERRGWARIYDLPIGHHGAAQRMYAEERERRPEWASTLEGLRDSPAKLARKDEELGRAQVVVACSEFVRATLLGAGYDAGKVRVVPFGAPPPAPPKGWTEADRRRPLRVLFAGAIGQRKGFADLVEAVAALDRPDIELIAMGRRLGEPALWARWGRWFRHEPPRPHAGVLALMRSCDVLALPSLFEGLALVQLEALSQGLPLLITPNTGAAELIEEGKEGFVVPIRAPERLAERLAWLADHREALPALSAAATARAATLGWEGYRRGLRGVVAAALGRELPP